MSKNPVKMYVRYIYSVLVLISQNLCCTVGEVTTKSGAKHCLAYLSTQTCNDLKFLLQGSLFLAQGVLPRFSCFICHIKSCYSFNTRKAMTVILTVFTFKCHVTLLN